MTHTLILTTPQVAERACYLVRSLPTDKTWEVVIRPHKVKRSADQNCRMWAMLTDVAEQVEWYGQRLTKEEWKDVFSASLKQQKVVPGIDSGFVVVGQSTSKMSVAEMSELIELIMAFGCQKGVRWRDNRE